MGYLQSVIGHEGWYDTAATGGEFVRTGSQFHGWVSADGASRFRAEPGRYPLWGVDLRKVVF